MKTLTLILLLSALLFSGSQRDYQLQYLAPDDLVNVLDCRKTEGKNYLFDVDDQTVQLYLNASTNRIRLMGTETALTTAVDIIKFLDIAPRQFLIQVEIIEINDQSLQDVGWDWQSVLEKLPFSYDLDIYQSDEDSQNSDTPDQTSSTTLDRNINTFSLNAGNIRLSDFISIIKENNLGTVTNSPRIVTTNNRKGSILDGQHSTYVSRYSSYSNIYETEEINSGLSLEVTPSLGDGGFISLEITAKYTSLTDNISGSPVESGQILNNHVFVRDNEPFLLGAFKKLEEQENVRRVPLLGYVLPYLFSKKVKVQSEKNILVVLTPRVIDLQGSPVPGQDTSETKE